jgi:predicted metal-binding membrane protein
MTGASAWMMTSNWDLPHLLLLWAMWAVMMTGMMLPSASPFVLLYGTARRRSSQDTAARQIYAVAAGYLVVWAAFSLGATFLQRLLARLLFVSPMMEVTSVRSARRCCSSGATMTPLKRACLRQCQSPLGFLMSRWRGDRGAFAWGSSTARTAGLLLALMLLLFAGGVMNLVVIAALTVSSRRKLAPLGVNGRA